MFRCIHACLLSTALMIPTLSYAHEEPNKTLWEKHQADTERHRIAAAGVSAVTQWRQVMKEGQLLPKVRVLLEEYDSHGRLISISAFRNDSVTASAVYSFDPVGNMVSDIDLGPRGQVEEANVFHHDAEGRVVAGYALDSAGHSAGRFMHVFNRPGSSIRFIRFDERDSVAYTITYGFGGDFDMADYVTAVKCTKGGDTLLAVTKVLDAVGRPIEKRVADHTANRTYSFHYTYGPHGVQSIDRRGAKGELETHSAYARDLQGLCTGIHTSDAEGTIMYISTMTYEYKNDHKERRDHQ